jgi:hypothetical protein
MAWIQSRSRIRLNRRCGAGGSTFLSKPRAPARSSGPSSCRSKLELDPLELRLSTEQFQTARLGGFFGALRDALPDFWGQQVIERKPNGIDFLVMRATQAMADPCRPTEQELLDVAKQAVADCCSIAPEDVRVDKDGFIVVDNGKDATAALLLNVDGAPTPGFLFFANLLKRVDASPSLYRLINEINLKLPIGTLSFEEECISFYYKLPTRDPSAQLVAWLIRVIAELIDEHDDTLQEALGGLRWADEDEGGDEGDTNSSTEDDDQTIEDLLLRDLEQVTNDCNGVMMTVIANYVSEEEIADYAEADDEDKAFILEQLHRVVHSSPEEFQDYFRGYYGTPDNSFHAVFVEEGTLIMSQDEFFAQLDWNEILTLCRRHCNSGIIAARFSALTGEDYSREREKFPVQPWDGQPQWAMENGQYVASE